MDHHSFQEFQYGLSYLCVFQVYIAEENTWQQQLLIELGTHCHSEVAEGMIHCPRIGGRLAVERKMEENSDHMEYSLEGNEEDASQLVAERQTEVAELQPLSFAELQYDLQGV